MALRPWPFTNRPDGQTSGCDSTNNWMSIGAQVNLISLAHKTINIPELEAILAKHARVEIEMLLKYLELDFGTWATVLVQRPFRHLPS
jgi:hypothetical protein